ncbi:integrase-like protein [Kineococcus xinjiangensis]|uniref:Integrase-like protein n=1 Tax=Kineococcus xinjiangensis TaxID=512762 RepID=A0A2S6IE99_9ACTN|nr:hypothetical protein [Kineococcus xinjiangensis]PPK92517.1 integrase-like protein [Kineococcus xinjiangensis]
MSKRANGEGTVYQRKDGRWEAAIYVPVEGGGRRRRSLYGKTRREVMEKLREAASRMDRGLPAVDSSTRMDAYLSHWLQDVARPNLRAKTVEGYEAAIRRHLTPAIGSRQLKALAPADVRSLLAGMSARGLSPRTVQFAHSVLRSALSQAVRDELVHRNVASLVRPPRQQRRDATYLTVDDARKLLQAARGDRLEALYIAAVMLGLRRGELLGLPWRHVNLEAASLRVGQTVQRIAGQLVIEEPKSRSSASGVHESGVRPARLTGVADA